MNTRMVEIGKQLFKVDIEVDGRFVRAAIYHQGKMLHRTMWSDRERRALMSAVAWLESAQATLKTR